MIEHQAAEPALDALNRFLPSHHRLLVTTESIASVAVLVVPVITPLAPLIQPSVATEVARTVGPAPRIGPIRISGTCIAFLPAVHDAVAADGNACDPRFESADGGATVVVRTIAVIALFALFPLAIAARGNFSFDPTLRRTAITGIDVSIITLFAAVAHIIATARKNADRATAIGKRIAVATALVALLAIIQTEVATAHIELRTLQR